MNLLLTGATGFLGSHLVRHFMGLGHKVVALNRPTSSTKRLGDLAHDITWYPIEFISTHPEMVFDGVNAVIHSAACYGRSNETMSEMQEANVVFPTKLLEVACRCGVPAFINTGSALPKEFNLYSLSKAHFVDWGKYVAKERGITFANLVLDQMYGPYDDPSKFPDLVINACLANQPTLRLTLGDQQRDFVYIEDVTAAYQAVLEAITEQLQGYQEIAVGSGKAIRIREFVEKVKQLTHSTTVPEFGAVPYRNNEVMYSVSDTTLLKSLGWACQHDLETGLLKTIRSKQS